MKKLILLALVATISLASRAQQFYGIDVSKLGMLVEQTELLPQDNAIMVMKSTLTALAANPMGYRKAMEFAEQRLGNPADSLHNEQLYITCLEHAATGFVLSGLEKQRPQMLLNIARKNQIGTTAADLEYVKTDGKTARLSDAAGKFVLLYFNDPDCDACAKVKDALETSNVKKYVEQGLLTVLAINPENNEKKWKKASYPAWMVNGWDKAQAINENSVYAMPASLPVFYLLSPERVVLAKNEASLKRVEQMLDKVMLSSDRTPETLVPLLFNR